MSRSHLAARGRDRELTALLAGDWRDGHGRLVVLRGHAGAGGTTVLAAARRSLRGDGVRVIVAADGAQEGPGVSPIVAGLRDEFEHVGVVGRLSEIVDDLPRITVELGEVFERIARNGPVALLVDDAARIPAAALFAARRPGCLVIAAGDTPELTALADAVVDLGPLPDDVIETVLERQAGLPLDAGLLTALREALGPWFGNPGTAAATLTALNDRLVLHRGRMCLRDAQNPIGLPPGHELLTTMRRLGGLAERLVATIAARGRLDVDELPPLLDVLGGDLAACGRTLDLLVENGVLIADGYEVRAVCPALATTVLARADDVHDVLAEAAASDPQALAEHLAHVHDVSTDPYWLIGLARDLEPTDPTAALRHYVTALRAGRPCAAVLDRVLALTVRTGQYDWVHRIDETWLLPTELPAATSAALHAVSWLATVHTGRPLEVPACEWFDLIASSHDEVRSIGDATSRQLLVSRAELERILSALAGEADDVDLVEAGRLGDLATVLEIVLGNRYQAPKTGPVAVYRRLLRGYRDGDWTAALSAARELELRGAPSPRALAFARIFAAEICAVRGENDLAEQWLADVTPDRDNEALHAWARIGMLWHGGDPTAAVRLARQDRWQDSVSYGLDRLLSRAATAAVITGDRIGAVSILRTLESHRLADPSRVGEERLLLARGMVYQDQRAAAASIDLAKGRHRTFDLLVSQIRLGEIAEDAGELLREAYRLAERIGADGLRQLVVEEFRTRGIAMPHAVATEFSAVEQRVIAMVRRGRTNQQIASALGVRPKTVEIYLTRLLAKTGTRSRVELIAASLSA